MHDGFEQRVGGWLARCTDSSRRHPLLVIALLPAPLPRRERVPAPATGPGGRSAEGSAARRARRRSG